MKTVTTEFVLSSPSHTDFANAILRVADLLGLAFTEVPKFKVVDPFAALSELRIVATSESA